MEEEMSEREIAHQVIIRGGRGSLPPKKQLWQFLLLLKMLRGCCKTVEESEREKRGWARKIKTKQQKKQTETLSDESWERGELGARRVGSEES